MPHSDLLLQIFVKEIYAFECLIVSLTTNHMVFCKKKFKNFWIKFESKNEKSSISIRSRTVIVRKRMEN